MPNSKVSVQIVFFATRLVAKWRVRWQKCPHGIMAIPYNIAGFQKAAKSQTNTFLNNPKEKTPITVGALMSSCQRAMVTDVL